MVLDQKVCGKKLLELEDDGLGVVPFEDYVHANYWHVLAKKNLYCQGVTWTKYLLKKGRRQRANLTYVQ